MAIVMKCDEKGTSFPSDEYSVCYSYRHHWQILETRWYPRGIQILVSTYLLGGGGILASQNWKVLKCQDLHEFQFSGVVVLGEGGCDQIPE